MSVTWTRPLIPSIRRSNRSLASVWIRRCRPIARVSEETSGELKPEIETTPGCILVPACVIAAGSCFASLHKGSVRRLGPEDGAIIVVEGADHGVPLNLPDKSAESLLEPVVWCRIGLVIALDNDARVRSEGN
jgi:hypothetical protein